MGLMRSPSAWTFILASVFTGSCQVASGAAASKHSVKVGQEFVLAPSESARLGSLPGAIIRFRRVLSDDRCPRRVNCTISGPITVEVEITLPGAEQRLVQLSSLNRNVGGPQLQGIVSCTPIGKFMLRLRDVQPWPSERGPVSSDAYRANFSVEESCDKQ